MKYNNFRRNEVILMAYKTKDDSDVLKIFGNNIRSARQKRRLTIRQLAKSANCSRDGLSLIENGERNLSFATAKKIARALDIALPILVSRNFITHADESVGNKFTDDDFILIFAENIKKRIMQEGMEQRYLYIDTNIPEGNISRILRGKNKNPRLKTLDILSKAIQTELTDLFTR